MTSLRKCPNCKQYTLQEICKDCKTTTVDAHYKYNGLREVIKDFKTKRFRKNKPYR